MTSKHNHSNPYFLLLVVITISLISLALVVSWYTGQIWVRDLWQVCQIGLGHLQDRLSEAWQLVIPAMVLLVIVRSNLSIVRHIRATQRLKKLFLPLQEIAPARLTTLLPAHDLSVEDVVFLNLAVPHAFCLGVWRPRVWLTAGLVDLLTDTELAAVLAHETHHCRRRDPLRLLIGRTLKSGFFFLPVVGNLADAEELQQELAADQSAIRHFDNDLPLLCALQKLLAQSSAPVFFEAVYSPFNVTKARLQRLIYSSPSARPVLKQQLHLFFRWAINLGVITILSSTIFLSPQLEQEQVEIEQCVGQPISAVQHQSLLLDYSVGN
jgi:Zn-dependent protease with chaperone function